MCLKTYRRIVFAVIGAMVLSACAAAPPVKPAPARAPAPSATRPEAPSPPSPAPLPKPGKESAPLPSSPPAPAAEPRVVASLELTEQGRLLLKRGQPDQAIGALERALNLNPGNGRACYYLAEAWLAKGNARQAKSFNRLAQMHLPNDGEWKERVLDQRRRIEK